MDVAGLLAVLALLSPAADARAAELADLSCCADEPFLLARLEVVLLVALAEEDGLTITSEVLDTGESFLSKFGDEDCFGGKEDVRLEYWRGLQMTGSLL